MRRVFIEKAPARKPTHFPKETRHDPSSCSTI